MYRIELMLQYNSPLVTKNILYTCVDKFEPNVNGFFHIWHQIDGKSYHRGISLQHIVSFTITNYLPISEEQTDENYDN